MIVAELESLLNVCPSDSRVVVRTTKGDVFFIDDILDEESFVEILLDDGMVVWND